MRDFWNSFSLVKMLISRHGKKWIQKKSARFVLSCRFLYIYSKERVGVNRYIVPKNYIQGVQLLEQLVIKENYIDDDAIKDLCYYYISEGNYNQLVNCAQKIKYQNFYRNFYLGCAYYFMKDYKSARLYLRHTLDKDRGFYEDDKLGLSLCLLGECFEKGLGGSISYNDAEKCYKYSLEKCGYNGAYAYYGDYLSNDKIFQMPNYEIAFGCYLQGANNNDAYCCYMVSQYYKQGIGVNKDSKLSGYWLKKAKENGWEKKR